MTKNAEARIVVLNDEAQALLEEVRGEHPVCVFTHQHHRRRRTRYSRLNSTGWRNARARAAARYQEEQGQEAPEGFRCVRVQDLRHTFGRRLRAAGVSLEDRKALLGHKDREITTHYSAPEIGCLIVAANRIQRSRLVHTPTARVVMDNHGLGRAPAQQEVAL